MAQLRVRGLGKAYKRYPRKLGRALEWLGAAPQHELRWVLRDVGFDVRPGESMGIVGANGAGKSTLLKLIARTIQPTTGAVECSGSVAALLELGVGFHPDFTGRQNVYMSGSIRGLGADRIQALMGSIEEFAEIGDYIDQPVRTYSSGMQVRLAFSLATAVRPEILIVDEALSVGDIYFQQKCFDRIREFRDAGTTLLFVTHVLPSVFSLCSRAIYLEDGRVRLDGTPKEVIDLYQATIVGRTHKGGVAVVAPPELPAGAEAAESQPAVATEPQPAATPAEEGAIAPTAAAADAQGETTGSYTTDGVTIHSVRLRDETGKPTEVFLGDSTLVIEIEGAFERAVEDPHFGFQIRDRLGQALYMTTTHGLRMRVGAVAAGERRVVRFRLRPLVAPGQYTVTAGIANRGRFDGSFEEALVRRQDVAAFTVVEPADAGRWSGLINLLPTVEVGKVPRE